MTSLGARRLLRPRHPLRSTGCFYAYPAGRLQEHFAWRSSIGRGERTNRAIVAMEEACAGRRRQIVGHTSRIGALRPLRTREECGRSRTRRWLEKHRRQRTAELRRAVAQPARRAAARVLSRRRYHRDRDRGAELSALVAAAARTGCAARRLARLSGGVADRGASGRAS